MISHDESMAEMNHIGTRSWAAILVAKKSLRQPERALNHIVLWRNFLLQFRGAAGPVL